MFSESNLGRESSAVVNRQPVLLESPKVLQTTSIYIGSRTIPFD